MSTRRRVLLFPIAAGFLFPLEWFAAGWHSIMHLVIVVLAVFIVAVSFLAYARTRQLKLLLISGGFTVLTLREMFTLVNWDAILGALDPHLELTHFLSLWTLLLLFVGLVKE